MGCVLSEGVTGLHPWLVNVNNGVFALSIRDYIGLHQHRRTGIISRRSGITSQGGTPHPGYLELATCYC